MSDFNQDFEKLKQVLQNESVPSSVAEKIANAMEETLLISPSTSFVKIRLPSRSRNLILTIQKFLTQYNFHIYVEYVHPATGPNENDQLFCKIVRNW